MVIQSCLNLTEKKDDRKWSRPTSAYPLARATAAVAGCSAAPRSEWPPSARRHRDADAGSKSNYATWRRRLLNVQDHLTGSGCESNMIGTSPYLGYGFVINGGLDSGPTAVVTNPGWTTATSFASGTTYLIQSTGPTTF